MKLLRHLYLGTFLVYGLFAALLLFPQVIITHKIPRLFGLLAASMFVLSIMQIFRIQKEGVTFSRLIPAIVVPLVLCSHVAALFVISTPVTEGSAAFLFYLITALVNAVLSAVGFFLK